MTTTTTTTTSHNDDSREPTGKPPADGDEVKDNLPAMYDAENTADSSSPKNSQEMSRTNTGYEIRRKMSEFSELVSLKDENEVKPQEKPVPLDGSGSTWNRVANACYELTEGKHEMKFQLVGMCAILTAAALAGVKEESGDAPWLLAVEWIITVLFTIEALIRFCGSGVSYPLAEEVDEARVQHELAVIEDDTVGPFETYLVTSNPLLYFKNSWNLFDFVVVIICYIPDAGAAGMVLRLLRVLRMLRLLHMVPQLQLIIKGLMSGLSSIVIILLLLFLVLYMYSIVGMVLFQNNDPTHFRTLDTALLSMFRVVTGEDWTDVMYINWFGCAKYGYTDGTVDDNFNCDRDEALNAVSPLYHISLMLIGSLVMLSLFIGVINTSMSEESEKYNARMKLISKLKYAKQKRGRVLSKPKIKKALEAAFRNDLGLCEQLLDEAQDEEHEEEAEVQDSPGKLSRMKSMMISTKNAMKSTKMRTTKTIHRLQREIEGKSEFVAKYATFAHSLAAKVNSDGFAYFSGVIISLASILVGLQTYDSLSSNTAITVLDSFCLYFFTLEIVLKVVACGLQPHHFFLDNWNVFDLLVVVLSFVYAKAKVVRVVRLLRIPKLAKSFPQIQIIIEGLIKGFGSVGYIVLLMFMEFYMYAIIGMALFRKNDPWHFDGIGKTFVTLFRCATLEDWTDVMYINIYGCRRYPENQLNDGSGYTGLNNGNDTSLACQHKAHGFVAALYFVSFIVIGSLVTLSLFVGVVTNAMQETSDEFLKEAKEKRRIKRVCRTFGASMDDAKILLRVFKLFDMDNEGTIDVAELEHVLHMVGRGVRSQDAEEILGMMDVDGTGDVSGDEFLEMMFIVQDRDFSLDRIKEKKSGLLRTLSRALSKDSPADSTDNLTSLA
ncbi:hypothetical protein RI054_19g85660 [Pseudoscourfieldia marina]